MTAIRREVREIVDQINPRRRGAEAHEHLQGTEQAGPIRERPRRHQRHEYEQVLDPLMRPHGADHRRHNRVSIVELGYDAA
jgi:hypothetical protein